ncbi:phosphoribosylglycinamide synthetase [Bisporella sp. PMI_857]|nr:phosphoribosylglycinamide synthetase [Bisporella sp. PMI_857]
MATLRVLLVGNGGREHALAWKLSQSPIVESIIVIPGNGGTASIGTKVSNNSTIKADDYPGLVQFAKDNNLNFVVPGPEAPLVDGIKDYFSEAGIKCYGPSLLAARMEGSKTFSKDFMKRHNIPTAAYENFSSYEQAKKYLESINHNVVLKASGLAAGKGVIIPTNKEEALDALKKIMLDKDFDSAGDEIVIEEFLEGDELSILSFSDGFSIRSLPPAQDHKRIFDGDEGPNTGGMGCYAPTRLATPALITEIEKTVLQPTIDGMRKEKFPFVGTLFTGLMITKDGPKCLEYNVRFGDPETQTLLPLMSADTDLAEVMLACTSGYLDSQDVIFKVDDRFSATVVVAAGGYPDAYEKGTPMKVDAAAAGTNIFHAGTIIKDGQLQTSGGRVIAAQSSAETLQEAVNRAYVGVGCIKFDNMFYRKDIAHRAFKAPAATKEALTYASAGVSIDAGNQFVERIKKAIASTAQLGAPAIIGGFGGEVDLSAGVWKDGPVLVGAIDGVGTKLMIALTMKKHDTVGQDLVGMNVNDLLCAGATPSFFLDYIGCSKLNLENSAAFVEGVAQGCRLAECALIGGETAEMPGLYQSEDYDAAGAAVGFRSQTQGLPKINDMAEGDVLLGLASDGVHSNGFSLVRKIVERSSVSYFDPAPWDQSTSVGLSLLKPTRIYVKSVLKVHNQGLILGLSHITGGGLTENVPRMLPSHLAAEIDIASWQHPPVFRWLKKEGNVESAEMARAFNNGVGMVAVVKDVNVRQAIVDLESLGERVYVIGKLVPRAKPEEGCVLKNLSSWD